MEIITDPSLPPRVRIVCEAWASDSRGAASLTKPRRAPRGRQQVNKSELGKIRHWHGRDHVRDISVETGCVIVTNQYDTSLIRWVNSTAGKPTHRCCQLRNASGMHNGNVPARIGNKVTSHNVKTDNKFKSEKETSRNAHKSE